MEVAFGGSKGKPRVLFEQEGLGSWMVGGLGGGGGCLGFFCLFFVFAVFKQHLQRKKGRKQNL